MRLHFYILFSLLLVNAHLFPQRLMIHHINVGQGDATLIRTSDGKNMLIDAGDTGKGVSIVLPFFKSLGVTSIDYLIASHYHSDHIGAIDKVIEGLSPENVRVVLDRGNNPPLPASKAFDQYWSAAQSTVKHQAVYPGQSIKLTDELSLQCLAADGVVIGRGEIKGSKNDENNRSIAWLLSSEHTEGGKNFSFKYFTGGDCNGTPGASADLETPLAKVVGDVDAMKINHHGSRYSTNRTFLDSLRPEAVIISVGDRNIYHHPAQETLDRLQTTTSVRFIYQTETGNGGTTAKVRTLGTVTICVFDSFFVVGSDSFRLQSHPAPKNQSESTIVPGGNVNTPNLIGASVEDGLLLLTLAKGMDISIKLFNLLGQEVCAQSQRHFPSGTHHFHLFNPGLPAGVYLVRISTPSGILTRKAILLR